MAKLKHEQIVSRIPNNLILLEEYKGQAYKHKFLCPFCNEEFESRIDKVLYGDVKSCGCVCLGVRSGTSYVSGTYFTNIKNNANKRGIEFNVTIEYITSLLKNQEFKCALSGLSIEVNYKRKLVTASLDRIDSKMGYIQGNVQWLHKDVNLMKNKLEQDRFLELCRLISKVNAGEN